jgi:hypothetical protein
LSSFCFTLIEGSFGFFGDFTGFDRASYITGFGGSICLTTGRMAGNSDEIGGGEGVGTA